MNTEKDFEELNNFLEQIKDEVDFSGCKDFDDKMIFTMLFCIKKAKQIERESCAKLCWQLANDMAMYSQWGANTCGTAIMAKGQE